MRRIMAALVGLAITLSGLVATAGSAQAATTCPKTARVCVDLTHNKAWLQYHGHTSYGPVKISSGRNHYRTPTGRYHIRAKVRHGYSHTFSAPMPYSAFFNGGIAFHEGNVTVKSHGCIHLSHKSAAHFFNALHVGNSVYVFGHRP